MESIFKIQKYTCSNQNCNDNIEVIFFIRWLLYKRKSQNNENETNNKPSKSIKASKNLHSDEMSIKNQLIYISNLNSNKSKELNDKLQYTSLILSSIIYICDIKISIRKEIFKENELSNKNIDDDFSMFESLSKQLFSYYKNIEIEISSNKLNLSNKEVALRQFLIEILILEIIDLIFSDDYYNKHLYKLPSLFQFFLVKCYYLNNNIDNISNKHILEMEYSANLLSNHNFYININQKFIVALGKLIKIQMINKEYSDGDFISIIKNNELKNKLNQNSDNNNCFELNHLWIGYLKECLNLYYFEFVSLFYYISDKMDKTYSLSNNKKLNILCVSNNSNSINSSKSINMMDYHNKKLSKYSFYSFQDLEALFLSIGDCIRKILEFLIFKHYYIFIKFDFHLNREFMFISNSMKDKIKSICDQISILNSLKVYVD